MRYEAWLAPMHAYLAQTFEGFERCLAANRPIEFTGPVAGDEQD